MRPGDDILTCFEQGRNNKCENIYLEKDLFWEYHCYLL
jgi:hypothetical protein